MMTKRNSWSSHQKSIARGIVSPTLHIGYRQVVATSTARNIGVMMDSKASMEAHVLSVCKSSFVHIRNLSRINKFLDSSYLERPCFHHHQPWLLQFHAMWCAIYTYQQTSAHPEHCSQTIYWAWKVWTHHTSTEIASLAAGSTKDNIYDTCPGI